MTHTGPMPESAGEFNQWIACSDTKCRKCRSTNVHYRLWESSDGAFEDYKYECLDCGHIWWIEGIDS